MLPNPNLVDRLVDQHIHELTEHPHGRHGWGTAPIARPAAWRRWLLALSALLFGGL